MTFALSTRSEYALKGVNPDLIGDRVRKQTGKDLAPFLAVAKAIEASRE